MLDLVVLSRNTVVLEAVDSMVVILEVADLALVSFGDDGDVEDGLAR